MLSVFSITVKAFEVCVPYLPDHCVLVDVASVKGEVPVTISRQASDMPPYTRCLGQPLRMSMTYAKKM
jgi:prephenate dehydrogenase